MAGRQGAGDATLAAAGMILIYAMIIGFTDNFVKVIAAEAGLWQFHATRTAMAIALLVVVARPLGLRLGARDGWAGLAVGGVLALDLRAGGRIASGGRVDGAPLSSG